MPITDAQWNAYTQYKRIKATYPEVLERIVKQKVSEMFPDNEGQKEAVYTLYMNDKKKGLSGRTPETSKLDRLVNKDPEYKALENDMYKATPSNRTIEDCEKIETILQLHVPSIGEHKYSMLPPMLQAMYKCIGEFPIIDRYGEPDGTEKVYKRIDVPESSGGSKSRRKNRNRRGLKKSRKSSRVIKHTR